MMLKKHISTRKHIGIMAAIFLVSSGIFALIYPMLRRG